MTNQNKIFRGHENIFRTFEKHYSSRKNRKIPRKIYKNFKTFYSIYKSVLKRACILCKKKQEITLYQWSECVTKLRGETTQY
jgi:hypothetical protein